jgi:2-amino-4-deoxychorismate synthase
MTEPPAVRDLLEQIQGYGAWAVIRRKASPTAGLVGGTPHEVASLLDIPLETGAPEPGRSADRLVAVPFRQVRERGFAAIDDGTPLTVVDIETEHEVSVDDLLAALPDVPVEFADRGGFATSDDDYGKVVEAIIRDEIGQGEGANLVIGRHYRAVVADWDAARALTVLRRLLERERGAYWTFCFFTGERFLIGASPERHVSVRQGDVRMNPISGTFRVKELEDPGLVTGAERLPRPARDDAVLDARTARLKGRLLEFLADEKEVFELFMVVDEELKMMCDICHEGGQVLGPFLKPMTHLIHTEYLLAGRSDRDHREILRDTMYAATVTGAPVENACRLIADYEPEGRGYYGAALALFGRSPDGTPTMDSPILIRTADVSPAGELKVTAGATLVRDSDPAYEVAETRAKAGGILSAFGLAPAATSDGTDIAELARDEDVVLALGTRNQRLSRFWLTDQAGEPADPGLAGKQAVILHGEDDFVNMLVHVLGVFGMTSRVVRHEDYTTGAFDGADLVVVGPGPGDPREGDHPKIAAFRRAVDDLLASGQPFLAVCLGHQTLCQRLGLDLGYKDVVFQGTQSPVRIDGRTERVGFYNTFVGRVPAGATLPDGVRVEADEATGDIHAIVGPHYRGIQFHAESILTENGYDLLHTAVRDLLA